ncbi:MAG: siroheme synthase CysG [Pseudomonadota bacterium]
MAKIPSIQHTESPKTQALLRMEALAVLPVFLKLEGRKVLLAGGSEGAAWKAELLAAAGADVLVVSEDLSHEMTDLLDRGAAAGSFESEIRPWSISDLEGIAVALGDFESDAEAQAFYCAAKAAKVPVNVIDNPKYCDFQFGTIVNRSPVVVGVSTDGAAPILGQAIRRKIEVMLPKALAKAGGLAKAFRSNLKKRIPDQALRRVFWERFVERAFRAEPVSERDLFELAERTSKGTGQPGGGALGFVSLVGSGPGDPDLLTIKAIRALQAADVIMFDDLSSPEILELARREAERLYVGKRGGRRSCKQDEINQMMIGHALSGKRVVRLKGGDPMIFGRAGEEIADLLEADVPFEIVPGITAGSAAASSLAVSLTHRDHAQSVRFVTGHSKSGLLPDNLHWQGMASGDTTLVFYMAARTANEVSENLMAHGMAADTPVVVVANASRPNERIWYGRLSDLVGGVEETAQGDPVIIGIGTVFSTYAAERRLPFALAGAAE